MKFKTLKQLKILDFDIENRPLTYQGQDRTTSDITAIACSWLGESKVHCWCLGEFRQRYILESFLEFYNEAGIVTGHYIRGHDLPVINGALMEHDLPSLSAKRTIDTYFDLEKRQGISVAQESLADMYDLQELKVHMPQRAWRQGNRLEDIGIEKVKNRVISDVIQHKAMLLELQKRKKLGTPKVWTPKRA